MSCNTKYPTAGGPVLWQLSLRFSTQLRLTPTGQLKNSLILSITHLRLAKRMRHSDLEEHLHEEGYEILRGRSSLVAAGMRRSARRRGLEEKTREPVDDCANYLLKYRDFLCYDHYLARGYPIATGVIEGACRYLVKDRMEITGARWSLEGAEAILRLLSLYASGDFDEYWDFHLLQEYQRHHASNHSQAIPPRPVQPPQRKKKSKRLRVVE